MDVPLGLLRVTVFDFEDRMPMHPYRVGKSASRSGILGTLKVGRSSALLRPVDVWEFTPSAGYTSCNVVAYLIWATSCEDNIGSGLGNLQPGRRYI